MKASTVFRHICRKFNIDESQFDDNFACSFGVLNIGTSSILNKSQFILILKGMEDIFFTSEQLNHIEKLIGENLIDLKF